MPGLLVQGPYSKKECALTSPFLGWSPDCLSQCLGELKYCNSILQTGGPQQHTLISHSSGGGKFKFRVPAWRSTWWGTSLVWVISSHGFSWCAVVERAETETETELETERHGGRESSSVSSSQGTNPIMRGPHLNLITYQSFHLQSLSHWELGLGHMNLGDNNIQSTEVRISGVWNPGISIFKASRWLQCEWHCSFYLCGKTHFLEEMSLVEMGKRTSQGREPAEMTSSCSSSSNRLWKPWLEQRTGVLGSSSSSGIPTPSGNSFLHSCTHTNICWMPNLVLGSGEIAMNEAGLLPTLMELSGSQWIQTIKLVIITEHD